MKDKIYIITFHWATNYGAVLQAYALQQHLIQQYKNTVKIIDYVPKGYEKTVFRSLNIRSLWKTIENLKEVYKEKKIKKFRDNFLITTKRFKTSEELMDYHWDKDIYVTGSDQIWNPFFTMQGEKKPVGVYYLDFSPENSMKISYAASFGTENITGDMREFIYEKLEKFSLLTIREKSGIEILRKMGFNAALVCDPVFLHEKHFYEVIFRKESANIQNPFLFSYILHNNQQNAKEIVKNISEVLEIDIKNQVAMTVEEWLHYIYTAKIVVTNSFHAVAFSLIFNVPFVVSLIKGSGMNDRIYTLLNDVGLEDRAVWELPKDEVKKICDKEIDWKKVNMRLEEKRKFSMHLLDDCIRGKKNGNL